MLNQPSRLEPLSAGLIIIKSLYHTDNKWYEYEILTIDRFQQLKITCILSYPSHWSIGILQTRMWNCFSFIVICDYVIKLCWISILNFNLLNKIYILRKMFSFDHLKTFFNRSVKYTLNPPLRQVSPLTGLSVVKTLYRKNKWYEFEIFN